MEFLLAILGPVVGTLLVPVKKHLGYIFSSTKHVTNMSTRMTHLIGTSVDVRNHMETNDRNNLEIPTRVPDWLEEVEKVTVDAERISSNVNGCFNLKMRYRAGRKAVKTTKQIETLIGENVDTVWRDAQKPLGEVSSKMASTSDGDAQNYFKSREKIFKKALGLLEQDQKAQVIALCGMGGVGKTTMMEQLKKAVEDKKMFDWVVKEVIGLKVNVFSIQQTVADYLGLPLTEKGQTARADRLREAFQKMSQESKKKVLVILDDVWEKVELKDIGLSPLPNGFKLLLTSRNEKVCTQIAVEANSDLRVVRVNVMEEFEANNFFCQISEVSNPELKDMGVEIVRRCGFLPLAIKIIATNLKSQERSVWRDTLRSLKENELDENVQRIIEISYTFIVEEDTKAIFLLCGLFPDDFNIPIEDLTRYAWGLKLLKKVRTLRDARDRTKACVLNLKNANLLLDSDHSECVKMHDLVLAFVVSEVSKGDHPWIINHDDVSNWSTAEMSESCGRISLTCMGMSELPRDFNCPNVSLLRLMNGDESLKFPEDFYERMENLQVMACEKLHYPLLPISLQCSTKLRTLCLHQCLLVSDCSPIGDHLLKLEVLSFAHSGIRYLPSAIGNLVELKLLDLTGCIDLEIADGVFKNLVKLEELYMTVKSEKGIRFTDINYKELEERSKNLSALEVEFYENNLQSKNMSYNKLERFKISMRRFLEANSGKYMHSSENTLMLVTNKDELLESGMNELFSKTEVLHLEAGGMNNFEEVLPKSVRQHSFYNLRVLCVSGCADLRYLFTVRVASGLVKLEDLKIRKCPVMEALVYSENGEEGDIIRFQELKHLSLYDLPMFVGFSNTDDVINLPELVELDLISLPNITSIYPATSVMSGSSSTIKALFNKKVMTPKLAMIMIIDRVKQLKSILPCGSSREEVLFDNDVRYCHNLRELRVYGCADLRYLFTVPVANALVKLERLTIKKCPVMEALVYSENVEEGDIIRFQELKHLSLNELPMLVGFSNTEDVIDLPQLVELELQVLPSLTSIFPEYKSTSVIMSGSSSAIKALFNKEVMIPRLEILKINSMNALVNIWPNSSEKVDSCSLRTFTVNGCDNLVNIFPSNSMSLLHHLEEICVSSCNSVKVLLDIDVRYCDNHEEDLPKFVPPHSLYNNLRDLYVSGCDDLRYLFTVPVANRLVKLESLEIRICRVMEALVYSENGEEGDIIRFQELKDLSLDDLPMMAGFSNNNNVIDLPQVVKLDFEDLPNFTSIYPEYKLAATSTSSCAIKPFFNKKVMIPRLETLRIVSMHKLKNIWPCARSEDIDACLQREIEVNSCDNLEIQGDSNNSCHECGDILEMLNLKILRISRCDLLEHVFTSSTLESLKQLEELNVIDCKAMQVIVKEDDFKEDGEHTTSKVVVFPHLNSLTLAHLPNVKGFFCGMNEFRWPQLYNFRIYRCPQMKVFTSGQSMFPKLNYMYIGEEKRSLEGGLNFQLTNASNEGLQF